MAGIWLYKKKKKIKNHSLLCHCAHSLKESFCVYFENFPSNNLQTLSSDQITAVALTEKYLWREVCNAELEINGNNARLWKPILSVWELEDILHICTYKSMDSVCKSLNEKNHEIKLHAVSYCTEG